MTVYMKIKKTMSVITLCLIISPLLHAQNTVSDNETYADALTDSLKAPQKWDLETCINYALRQNISLRQSKLSALSSEVDVKSAKAAFLPTLSGSSSQRLVNYPKAGGSTLINGNQITSSQSSTSYNGSYGVDLNWTLFNGTRVSTIRQNQVNKQIADLSVAENSNSIIENITTAYIQILYAAEAVKVNESTLDVSKANYERSKQLFDAGSVSKSDVAQLEAQMSQDKYNLVTSQATLANYKLQLKQLLELSGEAEMDLYLPKLDDETVLSPLPAKADVYRAALQIRPEIQAGELNVTAADLGIKIAKAGYLPKLSLSAGIGTSHTNGSDFTFSEQLKRNWNNSLGVTVSIPIFDARQTKNQIEKAKIQKQNYELTLLDQQKTLYKTIEGLWLDANSSQQQYISARDQVKSTQTSYELVQEQFDLGMKNTVELLTEKNNLLNAQNQMLQAKYMAIMNIQLLNFYQGANISLE